MYLCMMMHACMYARIMLYVFIAAHSSHILLHACIRALSNVETCLHAGLSMPLRILLIYFTYICVTLHYVGKGAHGSDSQTLTVCV